MAPVDEKIQRNDLVQIRAAVQFIAVIIYRPLNNMCSMFNFSEVTFEFTGAAQFAASM